MLKRIVIVGAGYAGVLTAKKLAKKFKKNEDVSITIIDKNPFHTMLTELHEVAAKRVDEYGIKISLKRIFTGRNVDVKLDTITSIDFDKKLVMGNKESYEYDYLVLSAGSKPSFYGIPGAPEHTFKLWSYEDAVILKDRIHSQFRKAAAETNIEEKKRLLTFHIVGAGFTGVEMAGELAEYVPILCDKHEIERELVTIYIIDVLKRTVPVLPEKLSRKVEKRLGKMGVQVRLDTCVQCIASDFIETKTRDMITCESTGTVIWTAGIEASEITCKASQSLQSANRGRIKLDPFLRSLDSDFVYVAGDNMFYIPKGEKEPVPQVVENCERSSSVVAHNIYCAITGQCQMIEYKPSFHGAMVSIGGRYGVARVGFPNRMINLPSFFAMFVKHFINIVYYFQILGWNKVISYLKYEFFTIRNRRSFLGGHFSNRTPSFLMVPLRVWLGTVWVFEGIMKIVEGWLVTPKLTGFFNGANGWYDSILNGASGTPDGVSGATQVAEKVADSVSGATGAAQETAGRIGTTILNFDFPGLFRAIFVSGKDLASSTLGDYSFKIDIPLVNWFIDKFILSSNSMQLFMQVFIVMAEVLIGLLLIGGLFTTPASALSLLLQGMFITTTGLFLGTFWMIFAAIALLIGAGRTIGLDYYVMPVLKNKWKGLPWIRKWYLYND